MLFGEFIQQSHTNIGGKAGHYGVMIQLHGQFTGSQAVFIPQTSISTVPAKK